MGLSDKDFNRLCTLIRAEAGIKMSDAKRLMLEGRLQKRMRALKIASHDRYCEYLFSKEGRQNELVFMIDEVTTNKTDFFRESFHFDYLQNKALPELLSTGLRGNLKCWSAGCSSGEEPYTLAMVLESFKKTHPNIPFDYDILATDLSTKVLKAAQKRE